MPNLQTQLNLTEEKQRARLRMLLMNLLIDQSGVESRLG